MSGLFEGVSCWGERLSFERKALPPSQTLPPLGNLCGFPNPSQLFTEV